MTGATISGGMMRSGMVGGMSRMWIPTWLTLWIGIHSAEPSPERCIISAPMRKYGSMLIKAAAGLNTRRSLIVSQSFSISAQYQF
jgi:hypothetical protein